MALKTAGYVLIGTSTPTVPPLTIGYVWMDMVSNKLKICTSLSPVTFVEAGGVGGASAWGAITGTLADQTDLQTALNAKAAAAHTHVVGDITPPGPGVLLGTGAFGSDVRQIHADGPIVVADIGPESYLLFFKNRLENGGTHEISVTGLSGLLQDPQTPLAHTHPISEITNLQTSLDVKQPLDSDLTTIAGLTPTTDNFMVAAASAWASRTPAQAKTSLVLVKADVGLANVDNTSDANKPVSTAQQTALNLKANIASPTFTGTVTVPGLTINDATDVVINATTGSKIGQAGSKIGFYGVAPAVRPTALTQTYATTSATHAAVTQLAAPAGGTGVAAGGWSSAANRDLAITSINAARTDIANLKNFVNQIVDQLQAIGLLQ